MCGIVGFWDFKNQLKPYESLRILNKMTDSLAHRGPDSYGLWHDAVSGLYLGHTRLAIVDLSPMGHQPMVSATENAVLTYNGEIYNALELKEALIELGYVFKGHSDTEVILAACQAWGVKNAVQKFIGMFAFAYWDAGVQNLFLVRDRMGIKPLYYGLHQGILFFSSELKTLHQHPKFLKVINQKAAYGFFQYGYVPQPDSI
ncbi:MAG: asparagine synthetase B family protein, partial [Gammaproteobacteria bacterium]